MTDNGIEAAHKTLTNRVIGLDGVTGTAIGLKGGKPCLKVYVAGPSRELQGKIPSRVAGFPVVIEKTGAFQRWTS